MVPKGITIDSGAAESLIPPNWLLQHSDKSSRKSKAGLGCGCKPACMGETHVTFVTDEERTEDDFPRGASNDALGKVPGASCSKATRSPPSMRSYIEERMKLDVRALCRRF